MTFSIYAHIKKSNRLPNLAAEPNRKDILDSPPYRPAPMPRAQMLPAPVKSSAVCALKVVVTSRTANSLTSTHQTPRLLNPLFVTSGAKTSTEPHRQPSSSPSPIVSTRKLSMVSEDSEVEEAEKTPVAKELQAGVPNPRLDSWAMGALLKKLTPPEPDTVSAKRQRVMKHRELFLKIRRSLRGRLLLRAPVPMRASMRYISPLTTKELETVVEAMSRPQTPVQPASPSPEAPKTPESQLQNEPDSSSEGTPPGERIRKFSVARRQTTRENKQSRTRSGAPKSVLVKMLENAHSPDKEIAPLVTIWTKNLVSKNEKLETAVKAKDHKIVRLETGNKDVKVQLSALQIENTKLKTRISRLAPAAANHRSEVSTLKEETFQITARANIDRNKVERLNAQLANIFQQKATAQKKYEAEITRLERISIAPSAQSGVEDELKEVKERYQTLEALVKDVLRVGGMMASDNFGELGVALKNLKNLMA